MKQWKAVLYREWVEGRQLLITFSIFLSIIILGLLISAIFVNRHGDNFLIQYGSTITINGDSLARLQGVRTDELLARLASGSDEEWRKILLITLLGGTQSMLLIGMMLFTGHLLSRGVSRDRKQGVEAFFRSLPLPSWLVLLNRLLVQTLGFFLLLFSAGLLYWLFHSVLTSITLSRATEVSFLSLLGAHWQIDLIGRMLLLDLLQLPWIMLMFAYLIGISSSLSRFEGIGGLLLPPLAALLEKIIFGTHWIGSMLWEFGSVPVTLVKDMVESYLNGKAIVGLSIYGSPQVLVASLLMVGSLVFAIWWQSWKEIR